MREAEADVCEFCDRGHVAVRAEEIAFHQWTDKGYVYCHPTLPVRICGECHAKTWDGKAEELINAAVSREYEMLR